VRGGRVKPRHARLQPVPQSQAPEEKGISHSALK
jgi:hypothetical protein